MAKDHGRDAGLRAQVEREVAAFAREDARVDRLMKGKKCEKLVEQLEGCLRHLRVDETGLRPVMQVRNIVRWTCENWVREDNEERIQAECERAGIDRSRVGSAEIDESLDDDRAAKKWLLRRRREIDDDLLGWRPMRVGRA